MKGIFRAFGLVIGVGLFVALEGCAGLHGGEGKRLSNVDLTLVSFGSINGELAPCG